MEQVEYLCKKLDREFHLHNVAAGFAVCVNTVDSCENQFLLQMAKTHDVF